MNFTSFHEDIDGTSLVKGLPDDRCQCLHWGSVLSGRLISRYADHEEIFEAGDAFYTPPSHVPALQETLLHREQAYGGTARGVDLRVDICAFSEQHFWSRRKMAP